MKVAILGGGISGLSLGWLLKQSGWSPTVFERQSCYGGLARSFQWHGFHCDIAAHRFYTTNQATFHTFSSLVPLVRNVRQSKIFIEGKWITDPVNPLELAVKFFPNPGLSFVWDYLTRTSNSDVAAVSFDSYALSQYGQSLTEFFFRPYTEKLFGISTNEISTSWATQKIRVSGILDMIKRNSKTYFSHFYYPKEGGYGAFCQRLYQDIHADVRLSTSVKALHTEHGKVVAITSETDSIEKTEAFDVVVSTLPLTILMRLLNIPIQLQFQSVSLVYLLLDQPQVSPNHWVYFAHKDFVMNRVSEFKNFSAHGVPTGKTVLCAEITMACPRDQIVERVIHDLDRSGFIRREKVIDTLLLDETFGYPIYTRQYEEQLAVTQAALAAYSNLFITGRNAVFTHMDVDENFESAQLLHETLMRTFQA
ncbi:protoporphyrinogen/coproporphyrinogen oxidase [Nitrospira sp. M1]